MAVWRLKPVLQLSTSIIGYEKRDVNGVMFCLKYGKDERLMAQTIFLSTALSMLTIPVMAMLV